jgi:hypothetical protein
MLVEYDGNGIAMEIQKLLKIDILKTLLNPPMELSGQPT